MQETDSEWPSSSAPVNTRVVGGLIALFERAVGLYATLINVNAYHQPGVEAGKKAAAAVLARQSHCGPVPSPQTADQIAAAVGPQTRPRRSTCCSNTWRPTAGPDPPKTAGPAR